MNPELAFEEVETARFVAEKLREFGYDVQTGLAKTGVVAVKRGSKDGPTIGIRADMDALPIEDQKHAEYSSTKENTAHLCGHDAHTAISSARQKFYKNTHWNQEISSLFFSRRKKVLQVQNTWLKKAFLRTLRLTALLHCT